MFLHISLSQVKEYREEVGSMATCHIITRMSEQTFSSFIIQVQKEYKKWVRRTTWLPECVRVKYGGARASYSSTPNQSTSSGNVCVFFGVFFIYSMLMCIIAISGW